MSSAREDIVNLIYSGRCKPPGWGPGDNRYQWLAFWVTWFRTTHNCTDAFVLYLPLDIEIYYPITYTFPFCLCELYSQGLVYHIIIATTFFYLLLFILLFSSRHNVIQRIGSTHTFARSLWWRFLSVSHKYGFK